MLDVKKVKEQLENKTISDALIVFVYGDSNFLASQYSHAVCEIQRTRGKTIKVIDTLDEYTPATNNLFSMDDSYFYVLWVDTLATDDVSFIEAQNLLIVCKFIDKETKKLYLPHIVELPKIEQWQLYDFAYTCTGIKQEALEQLVDLCKDPYRIDNEIFKIKLFEESQQSRLYAQMIDDECFSDLTNYVIWDLTNAIIINDASKVGEILKHSNSIDLDVFGLLSVLYSNFKNIIKVQLSKSPTAQTTGMSDKQFWAIKKNCNHYSYEQLLRIFECLTQIDYKIKSGELPTSLAIDYMLVNILGV